MSDNRQSFSSRNSWHFAVAKSFPGARVATKVLVEARIIDGAATAEWDFSTNTGWMRSIVVPQAVPATDGHAGYLGEGGVATRLLSRQSTGVSARVIGLSSRLKPAASSR